MEKIAYFIHSGRLNSISKECFNSLKKHCDCRILFYNHNVSNIPINVESYPIDVKLWEERRMTHKMEVALKLPIPFKSKVLVLDTDLLFKGDPFRVFEESNFDFFYTTRHFKSNFNVNAGVWGFINNKKSQKLLKFMINEANNPSWNPYKEFRKKFKRDNKRDKDWWTNQDLLCVLSENPPPDIKLYDAGYKYNFCPKSGGGVALTNESINEFYSKIKEPSFATIFHYKELKRIIKVL